MKTIGVLGAGQLARMLALAGIPLGFKFIYVDPSHSSPASWLGEQIVAPFEDATALQKLADSSNLITYEFENIPVSVVRKLAQTRSVFPPPIALESSQDRLLEKQFFNQHGIDTAPFYSVDDQPSLEQAIAVLKLPLILKTRRFGYDGKGQFLVKSLEDAITAFNQLGQKGIIAEGFVKFDRELSCIAVRGIDGATFFYPLVENFHHEGILRLSLAPAQVHATDLNLQASAQVGRILQALDYVGILAVEFFEKEGKLIANEMAPRVHNSGHWTIEGAETSQFENHIRAVAGLPLGDPKPRGFSAMINLIGSMPDATKVLQIPGAHLHDYGKEPRAGRKLGHLTIRADSLEELNRTLRENLDLLPLETANQWQNRLNR
ncbi:MAG: 5-(carboxyamino)imidazole ribonucleotide synthase [Planctomycetota bacterium]|nr:MAG: 5-(carboxyamino)imidazole ribonucleotide synthase [Planctomycetota bacterium]